MIEDKLSKEERIRLEALNQANQTLAITQYHSGKSRQILTVAKKYENYIVLGVIPPDG